MKFSHVTSDIKYLMATYLDPRYKQAFFTEREEHLVANEVLQLLLPTVQGGGDDQPALKIIKVSSAASSEKMNESKIDSILDNMLTAGSAANIQHAATTSFGSQSQIKNLLYLYNSEPRIDRNTDPLMWWKANVKYSSMYAIVRRFLSVPAASASSERLFQESAHVYGDMRAGLSPESASKILLIKSNYPSDSKE